MPLRHNSCADEPPICTHERNCDGGSSRLPDDRSASCDAGSSRVSVSDSDLMITSAPREDSATVGATLGSSSCPGADLHNSLHAMNRLDESLLNSRHQPRMFFSSNSAAAADHERGFSVAGGWSPRCYACSFCGREFNSAQALGGHMNIHRRDRARLRTSSSSAPASLPHQSDFAPFLQNTPQSAHTNLYNTFEAAFRENPTTISSYTAPNIISPAPTFRLLDMHPPADPASVAYPSQDENPTAPFSAPLGDLLPFCSTRSSSGATRFSKAHNEAHSLFPNIAPHASPLPIRPNLENSSLKHVEALNICAGQASTRHAQLSLDCETSGGAQLIQFSQAKGRLKRARGDALDSATASSNSTGQRSGIEQTSTEKSSFLHAAADAPGSCPRPTPHIKGLLCLDLELRLGQSSSSDSRAASSTTAGDCFMWTTAPRPP